MAWTMRKWKCVYWSEKEANEDRRFWQVCVQRDVLLFQSDVSSSSQDGAELLRRARPEENLELNPLAEDHHCVKVYFIVISVYLYPSLFSVWKSPQVFPEYKPGMPRLAAASPEFRKNFTPLYNTQWETGLKQKSLPPRRKNWKWKLGITWPDWT